MILEDAPKQTYKVTLTTMVLAESHIDAEALAIKEFAKGNYFVTYETAPCNSEELKELRALDKALLRCGLSLDRRDEMICTIVEYDWKKKISYEQLEQFRNLWSCVIETD